MCDKNLRAIERENEYLKDEIKKLRVSYAERLRFVEKMLEIKDNYLVKLVTNFVELTPLKLPISREQFDAFNEAFNKETKDE